MKKPLSRHTHGIPDRPIEPRFGPMDGPFFLPSMVGYDRMEYRAERHLFHDFGTDAVDHVTSLIMTVTGSVTVSAPQHEQVLGPGEVLIITTPQPVRLLLRKQGCPWEFLYVNFKDAQGRQALEWLRKRQRGIFRLPAEGKDTKGFVAATRGLIRGLLKPGERTTAEWSVEFYRWFMRLTELAGQGERARGRAQMEIGASPGLVATHFRTLKEYARQMNYSPGYLSRKLAKTWHKAPGATLKEAQLQQACRLLERDEPPVGEVAGMVGYQSASSFIRAFRQRLGMTPRAYRRAAASGEKPAPARAATSRARADGRKKKAGKRSR